MLWNFYKLLTPKKVFRHTHRVACIFCRVTDELLPDQFKVFHSSVASKEPHCLKVVFNWSLSKFCRLSWVFHSFSVLAPGHFQRNTFFLCSLSPLALTYESFKQEKASNSRDEPALCLHKTDKIAKKLFKTLPLGTFYAQPVTRKQNLLKCQSWLSLTYLGIVCSVSLKKFKAASQIRF